MSHNHSLYNNYRGNYTFQRFARPRVPPPPAPPPFFFAPAPWAPESADKRFIKDFEARVLKNAPTKQKTNTISIYQKREIICNMLDKINNIKQQQKLLEENLNEYSEEEWNSVMEQVELNKAEITKLQVELNDNCLETLRKLLAKRAAKRLRLKRLHTERKRQKEEMIRESEEKSRKIDENLQKLKDDISRVKQEEASKLEADMVLKDVLRKKHDARKYVAKLDALVRLRLARASTARARGEPVSERDAAAFITNIEKLKSLWSEKLEAYDQEEAELRDKLKENSVREPSANEILAELTTHLEDWRRVLFGADCFPQDYCGDAKRFMHNRSEWDKFLSDEGTPLPIGWVPPAKY